MPRHGLHSLSSVDDVEKVAICSNCGRVRIYIFFKGENKAPQRVCSNAALANIRKYKSKIAKPKKIYEYVPPPVREKKELLTHEEIVSRRRETDIARDLPKRVFIDNFKLDNGCRRCGYKSEAYTLDLHHRNPGTKDAKISELVKASWEKLHAELEKCDVLCAICHRIEHHERGWS